MYIDHLHQQNINMIMYRVTSTVFMKLKNICGNIFVDVYTVIAIYRQNHNNDIHK